VLLGNESIETFLEMPSDLSETQGNSISLPLCYIGENKFILKSPESYKTLMGALDTFSKTNANFLSNPEAYKKFLKEKVQVHIDKMSGKISEGGGLNRDSQGGNEVGSGVDSSRKNSDQNSTGNSSGKNKTSEKYGNSEDGDEISIHKTKN